MKRSKRRKADQGIASLVGSEPKEPYHRSIIRTRLSVFWIPLLLAAVTFLVYWPSLKSGFVYDGRKEILQEGFITSLSNLSAILSLKALGMNLMLKDRPGQLLYLMLDAAIWGKDPWGYHLSNNLLHAANVALLFVLLRRLIATELTGPAGNNVLKVQVAMVVATLIFALHPIATEPVAAVGYSSDLLVTLFTLLALLSATAFRPENGGAAIIAGGTGTLCCFAAVLSKESGLAAPLLLIVYWFLFRRSEAKRPWLLFLGAAVAVTVAALTTILHFAASNQLGLGYLGGSFSQVLLVQPRLWVFMMGQLIWPAHLSADYTLENVNGLSTPLALMIFFTVVSLQAWLAAKSRIGALGVAIYWLGLATVSNFLPLYCFLADRFYYLPLAGVSLQLMALLLMPRSRPGFCLAAAPLVCAILPLTLLTLTREQVFATDLSLWSDTTKASPFSFLAQYNLAGTLAVNGQVDEAAPHYQRALEIKPNHALAHNNFGNALLLKGRLDQAISQFQMALAIDPANAETHNSLGIALAQKGQVDAAMAQFQMALAINPAYAAAQNNLGKARATALQSIRRQ